MTWVLAVLGAVFSLLLMLPVAIKWRLPKLPAVGGVVVAALIAAGAFLWIYPLLETGLGRAVAICGQMALALSIAFSLAMWRFWRDPERQPPEEENVVLSAADGAVIYIRAVDEASTPLVTKNGRDFVLEEFTGTSLLGSATHVIGIEMNLLDVHVNRCPIAGQVNSLKHIAGKFMSLRKDEAQYVNERFTTVIENSSLTVIVVQVASRLVRRIESHLSVSEKVDAGQRLGMIRFGSLVAVVLPQRQDVSIEVKLGDHVSAGVTVLARYEVATERAENRE